MNPIRNTFTIALATSLSQSTHKDWITQIIPALCENNSKIITVDENIADIADGYKKNIGYVTPKELWSNANGMIFFDPPSDEDLLQCQQHKIIPICPERSPLENFKAEEEIGNAFLFTDGNFWQCLHAIIRASVNFEFSYDWSNLKKNFGKTQL